MTKVDFSMRKTERSLIKQANEIAVKIGINETDPIPENCDELREQFDSICQQLTALRGNDSWKDEVICPL